MKVYQITSLSCEVRLGKLDFHSFEFGRMGDDLIEIYGMLMGLESVDEG